MPYWRSPFTIQNGDTASASYLTSMVQVSGYASAASVLIGNAATSTSQSLTEITIGSNLSLSTSGVLNTSSIVSLTSATITSLTVTTIVGAVSIPNGGTGVTSVAAANQALTPATVAVTESAGAIGIDWSLGNSFYCALNANATVSFSNTRDGQVVVITLLNTGSNYTVTWPAMKWVGGVAPTMTIGAKYDIYTVVYNAAQSVYFGSYVQNLS